MRVKIINKSNNPIPNYETDLSAGMDLRAFTENSIILNPGERKLVKTGLQIELPKGYEGQVRPRSGLAFKKGVTVLNSPGTIDADYRGDIGVILVNHSNEEFIICNGDRIAQFMLIPIVLVDFDFVEEFEKTERASGGFGHSGTS